MFSVQDYFINALLLCKSLYGSRMGNNKIYKIFLQIEWNEMLANRCFSGSLDDKRDGFIHLSTSIQLAETLSKHFHGQDSIVVAEVDAEKNSELLKYEFSRGGNKFPHLYGNLELSSIINYWTLSPDDKGAYDLSIIGTD
jgi:uncharacterized protein (DUF952 family)